jgi:NADH-quinone oxidoreductase subunit N
VSGAPTAGDLQALLPILVLSAGVVVLMLAAVFRPGQGAVVALAIGGLAATVAVLPVAAAADDRDVTLLLRLDDFALFFIGVLTVTTAAVALLAHGYLRGRLLAAEVGELFMLLLSAALGGAVLAASTHFVSFFVGLEILSVSLYALIAYPRHRAGFVEAAVKYLVLAGVTSAFLLLGMALVYFETGTMTVAGLSGALAGDSLQVAGQQVAPELALVLVGVALMVVGIGFKLAVVPFHMWTPDIYQGAPAPVTALIATVSKGAMIALLVRFFRGVDLSAEPALFWTFAAIAFASMIAGNLLALLQDNVKRLLAYSSIAHLGYMLVAFLAAGELAVTAVSFYVVVYVIANLIAFGIVSELSGDARDAERIEDYRGLAARRPWLAGAMAAALFSLAGLPLTAGFVGKFYLVRAGAGEGLWALVIVLVVTSALSLYYYTRVIVAMYVQRPLGEEAPEAGGVAAPGAGPGAAVAARSLASADARLTAWPVGLVLAVMTALLVLLGVYPTPLVRLIERVAESLP